MRQITPVVRNILIINVCIFLVPKLLEIDLVGLLGLRYIFSTQFKGYQLLTHLFTHASFYHLFSNMFTLISFGPILEQYFSSKRFIALYLVTGLGAVILYMLVAHLEISRLKNVYDQYFDHPTPKSFMHLMYKFPQIYTAYQPFIDDFFSYPENPAYLAKSQSIATQLAPLIEKKINRPIVGASGATFGLLTSFAMLFPHARFSLFFLPILIKAKHFVILYGLYELHAGLQGNPADNVAHFAHLGGILFAYLFVKWYRRRERIFE